MLVDVVYPGYMPYPNLGIAVDVPGYLKAHRDALTYDFDALAAKGTMLGSGGIIVFDHTTDMVDALYNILRFYHHESCGQCTPCREGTPWVVKVLERICSGEGRTADMDLLLDIADNMEGRTVCALADGAASPINSSIKFFREEYEEHVRLGHCPFAGGGAQASVAAGSAGASDEPGRTAVSVSEVLE